MPKDRVLEAVADSRRNTWSEDDLTLPVEVPDDGAHSDEN